MDQGAPALGGPLRGWIQRRWRLVYGGALAGSGVGFLAARAAGFLGELPAALDVVVGFGLGALLLSPLFREVSFGGVTLKRELERTREELSAEIRDLRLTVMSTVAVSSTVNVHGLVQEEVGRSQMEAIGMLAELDRELLEEWEWEGSSVPAERRKRDARAKKLELLNERFEETASRLRAAAPADRAQYAWALRYLYWELLDATRRFAGGAGAGYAKTRARAIEQMDEIAQLGRSAAKEADVATT